MSSEPPASPLLPDPIDAAGKLHELVRIGYDHLIARAHSSARMARSLSQCRTPLDAVRVYQDWLSGESERIISDMRKVAALSRSLLDLDDEQDPGHAAGPASEPPWSRTIVAAVSEPGEPVIAAVAEAETAVAASVEAAETLIAETAPEPAAEPVPEAAAPADQAAAPAPADSGSVEPAAAEPVASAPEIAEPVASAPEAAEPGPQPAAAAGYAHGHGNGAEPPAAGLEAAEAEPGEPAPAAVEACAEAMPAPVRKPRRRKKAAAAESEPAAESAPALSDQPLPAGP